MADEQPNATPDSATETTTNAIAEETAPEASATAETAPPDHIAELEARVAELQAQVERERDQATEYMRHWHTAQADLANYKRRSQQDQEQRERLLVAQAHASTLHALDSLERAFLSLPPTLRTFSWIEGIALVELQLRRALDLQGIRAIAVEPGQPFDPQRHEAIGEVETAEFEEGAVAVVAQQGYEMANLLIRPALVQLARKPAPASPSDQSATDATPET